MYRKEKGYFKEHDRWMADEIDDYALKYDPPNIIQKYTKELIKNSNDAKGSGSTEAFYKDNCKTKTYKVAKFHPSTNFAEMLKQLRLEAIQEIALYLDIKDFAYFIRVCKTSLKLLDTEEIWKILFMRDFPVLRYKLDCNKDLNDPSMKELYRFWLYKMMPEQIRFYTTLFLEDSMPLAIELTKALVDIKSVKNSVLAQYVQNIIKMKGNVGKEKLSWRTCLKLSWVKPKNEIFLWIAGLNIARKIPLGSRYPKKYETIAAYVLRQYKFRKEERICDVFFLEKNFLVVEIQEEEQTLGQDTIEKEQHLNSGEQNQGYEKEIDRFRPMELQLKRTHTFVIFDLEKELKYKISGEEYPQPFKCPFKKKASSSCRKEEGNKMCLLSKQQEAQTYEIDYQHIDTDRTNICIKVLNEDEFIFFTKATESIIMIFNRNIKQQPQIFNIKLDSVLFDLVPTKKLKKSETSKLFVIDESAMVYCITYSQEQNKLNTQKLKQETPHKQDTCQPNPTRFPKDEIKYYHGVTQVQKDKEATVEIEFLVTNRNKNFYIFDLENLKAFDFYYSFQDKYNNHLLAWDVIGNSLCIMHQYGFSVFEISFTNCFVKYLERFSTYGWECSTSFQHWFSLGSCYTLLAGASSSSFERADIQVAVIFRNRMSNYDRYELSLENILNKHEMKEGSPLPPLQDVQVKLEDSVILIRTPRHTFFCDLEAYRRTPVLNKIVLQNQKNNDNNNPSLTIKIDFEPIEEEEKKEEERKLKLLAHTDIPENLNQMTLKKVIPGYGPKKFNQEERKQEQIIRKKGPKYYKNIRREEQREKYMV